MEKPGKLWEFFLLFCGHPVTVTDKTVQYYQCMHTNQQMMAVDKADAAGC